LFERLSQLVAVHGALPLLAEGVECGADALDVAEFLLGGRACGVARHALRHELVDGGLDVKRELVVDVAGRIGPREAEVSAPGGDEVVVVRAHAVPTPARSG
jgi:hypothetical protein